MNASLGEGDIGDCPMDKRASPFVIVLATLVSQSVAIWFRRCPLGLNESNHSGLIFASFTNLVQRTPSSAKNLVKSSGDPPSAKA